MHIVQLISHYLPAVRFGGPQQVAHGLGRALVQNGHRVSVCTTNLKDEQHDLDVPLNQVVDLDGVEVNYFPVKWNRYWGFAPGMWAQSKQLIADADAVFVHFHYQYANWVGSSLARKADKPYIVFAHGSFKRDAVKRRSRWLKQTYLSLAERRNLQSARKIVFNAEEEQRMSHQGQNGIVIPNAIEPGDFSPLPSKGSLRASLDIPDDRLLFLFLGRIDYHGKGLDLLLEAIANSGDARQRFHVVFAGPSERTGTQKLMSNVKRMGVEDSISVVGMLTGNDKLSALVDADAFLLPSRSEGLSIALLEALYLGIPVLITDQVGLHQQVKQNGAGCVVPVSAAGVQHGLEQMIDSATRNGMRGRATAWITAEHTWSAVAKQVLPLLEATS